MFGNAAPGRENSRVLYISKLHEVSIALQCS